LTLKIGAMASSDVTWHCAKLHKLYDVADALGNTGDDKHALQIYRTTNEKFELYMKSVWKSTFFCVECFEDCKDATAFVRHKVAHTNYPVKIPNTLAEIQLKAESIVASEKTYLHAALLNIGEFVSDNLHLLSKRYNKALCFIHSMENILNLNLSDASIVPTFMRSYNFSTAETTAVTKDGHFPSFMSANSSYKTVPILKNTF
jgi:hypothetical protein